jgi:hypothetical protein
MKQPADRSGSQTALPGCAPLYTLVPTACENLDVADVVRELNIGTEGGHR